jgi:hypothetical protein
VIQAQVRQTGGYASLSVQASAPEQLAGLDNSAHTTGWLGKPGPGTTKGDAAPVSSSFELTRDGKF